jgi:hypothetical protein
MTFRDTTCADSWCDGTYRGQKNNFNFWNFGDSVSSDTLSYDNIVESSFYEGCLPGVVAWTSEDRALASFEATELTSFTADDPLSITLSWDTCTDLTLPTTSCVDFPCQRILPEDTTMANGTTESYNDLCYPNQGNPRHPNEVDWLEFSCVDGATESETFTQMIFAGIITAFLIPALIVKAY